MAKFAHADVLDNGPAHIKANATKMILVKAYALGDSYATVVGNAVATANMTSADYTLGNGASNARTLTTATKSATASVAADVGDAHFAFTDGTGKVLWVTDETGEAPNASGDTINFPALVYTSNQPI